MVGRDVEEHIRKKKPLPWDNGKIKKPRSGFSRLGARARKVKVPESGIW